LETRVWEASFSLPTLASGPDYSSILNAVLVLVAQTWTTNVHVINSTGRQHQ